MTLNVIIYLIYRHIQLTLKGLWNRIMNKYRLYKAIRRIRKQAAKDKLSGFTWVKHKKQKRKRK